MARPDGRIEPGQPLRGGISARAWNRAQQAADKVLKAECGVSGAPASNVSAPYSTLFVKNETNGDLDIGRAVRITDVELPDTSMCDNNYLFDDGTMCSQPVVVYRDGMSDGETGHGFFSWRSYGITVEPILRGTVGRIAVDGVVQAKILVRDEDDRYVSFIAANNCVLHSSTYGSASILWRSPPRGDQDAIYRRDNTDAERIRGAWALIRLGDGDRPRHVFGTADGAIGHGASGTMTVSNAGMYFGTSVTSSTVGVYNGTLGTIPSGVPVVAVENSEGTPPFTIVAAYNDAQYGF